MNENLQSPVVGGAPQGNPSIQSQLTEPINKTLTTPSLSQLILKTMPFFILRAGAALAISVAFVAYTFVCLLIFGSLAGTSLAGGAFFVALIMFIMALGVWRFIRAYLLYMVKAGHIAVVSEIIVRGSIPGGDQIGYGYLLVKRYFLAANAMFVLDNLIKRAISEIRNGLDTMSNLFSFIPGIKAVQSVITLFLGIFLGYSDEAIFGYIFQKGDSNVWKSAADGIVLYVQNWKEMLKSAGLVTAFLLGAGGIAAAFGFMLSSLATTLNLNMIIIVVITFCVFIILKWTFLDPVIMIYMTKKYLSAAVNQSPAIDLYEKIRGISSKFRAIIDKSSTSSEISNTPSSN